MSMCIPKAFHVVHFELTLAEANNHEVSFWNYFCPIKSQSETELN